MRLWEKKATTMNKNLVDKVTSKNQSLSKPVELISKILEARVSHDLPGTGVPLRKSYSMPQGSCFRGIKTFPEGSMSISLVLLYHLLSICHVIIFLSVCAYI